MIFLYNTIVLLLFKLQKFYKFLNIYLNYKSNVLFLFFNFFIWSFLFFLSFLFSSSFSHSRFFSLFWSLKRPKVYLSPYLLAVFFHSCTWCAWPWGALLHVAIHDGRRFSSRTIGRCPKNGENYSLQFHVI